VILLVPAHPGSPGQRAVKRLCVVHRTQNRIAAYDVALQDDDTE